MVFDHPFHFHDLFVALDDRLITNFAVASGFKSAPDEEEQPLNTGADFFREFDPGKPTENTQCTSTHRKQQHGATEEAQTGFHDARQIATNDTTGTVGQ